MILGKPKEKTDLEKEIDRVVLLLSAEKPETKEYAAIAKQLKGLHALQAQKQKPMDPNTILTVAANLAGILIIVGYEQKHVVTSKAVGMLRALR